MRFSSPCFPALTSYPQRTVELIASQVVTVTPDDDLLRSFPDALSKAVAQVEPLTLPASAADLDQEYLEELRKRGATVWAALGPLARAAGDDLVKDALATPLGGMHPALALCTGPWRWAEPILRLQSCS